MIALASDHAGFELKEAIKKYLVDNNYDIMDFGTNSPAPSIIRRLGAWPRKRWPPASVIRESSAAEPVSVYLSWQIR